MNMHHFVVIIHGPTGVGKTECVDTIATWFPIEVINGDMGQLYVPLTIGTAKPDLSSTTIAHHLFNELDQPEFFSVMAYRKRVQTIIHDIWQRKRIPLIVGGSSFYVSSLFFPPVEHNRKIEAREYAPDVDLWQLLFSIDPDRAQVIEKSDDYRIKRALDIWYSTGIKPSCYVPSFEPVANFCVLWLERDRDDLYARIDMRVHDMMKQGWLDEVRQLVGTPWESFIAKKKIIGYNELFSYVHGAITYAQMIQQIQQKTRQYAKRQITFWRALKEKIKYALADQESYQDWCGIIETVNLTNTNIERYSNHLKQAIKQCITHRSEAKKRKNA